MSTSVWTLERTSARYDDGRLATCIDLMRPELGLHELRFNGVAIPDMRILGVDLGKVAVDELSLPETYARVDDLVATYPQTDRRPYRLQAYWRRADLAHLPQCREVRAFDLQVSINTSLLDTRPTVRVVSRVCGDPADASSASQAHRVLIRPRDASWSYFEAAHPQDDRRTSVAAASADVSEIRHDLFGGFLEKGVIVRARIRGAFIPRANDEAAAERLYDDFLRAAPPLTT